MNKKYEYYIVCTDNKGNVQCVKIRDSQKFDLKDIDLYTSKFSTRKELLEQLYKDRLVSFMPDDVFIVNENKGRLSFQEVICGCSEDVEGLSDNKKVHDLLLDFAYKMTTDEAFNAIVNNGETAVYKKFYSEFELVDDDCGVDFEELGEKIEEKINKFSGYALKSYKLARNVLLTNIYCSNYWDNWMDRERRINHRYILREKIRSAISGEEVLCSYFNGDNSIEKIDFVMSFLENIQRSVFIMLSNYAIINDDAFPCVIPELRNLIGVDLAYDICRLLRDNDKTEIRAKMIERFEEDLVALNGAYQWCLIYKGQKAKGDSDGFQYRKSEKQ